MTSSLPLLPSPAHDDSLSGDVTTSSYQDESTDCAICLDPLVGEDEEDWKGSMDVGDGDDSERMKTPCGRKSNAGNTSSAGGEFHRRRPIITLRCGHKYHLDCVIQQIEIGSMTAKNDDQRLLFTGCQCAKCGQIFGEDDHPDLPKKLIRSVDEITETLLSLPLIRAD